MKSPCKVEKVEPVQAVSNKAVSDVEMVEPDQPASTSQVTHEKGQPSIHGVSIEPSAAPRLARPMTSTPLEPPEEPANGISFLHCPLFYNMLSLLTLLDNFFITCYNSANF